MFSMLRHHKDIFCIFSTYFNKETIKTSGETSASLGLNLHPANWKYLGTLQLLAKT